MQSLNRWSMCSVAGLSVVLAASGLASAQRRGPRPSEESFHFRFVGPAVGNRVASIAGIAGDPSTYYAGAASGGVWKSTDGGNRWDPIFDKEPAAAIGAITVAPSDRNVVWVGTGEAWAIRDTDIMGNGVYRSTDAGKTWAHIGLEETGRIGRIIVSPSNPDVAFVCALGRLTGPQPEHGVYRTMDAGQHWDRVLFVDENTGCSGLAMDPNNPRVLFAGMWQAEIHTWGENSGGPGSGVYVSRDGGTKWTKIEGHGMPKPPVGKIDVAVAPTNSNRVYALIQTKDQGSLWRTDDGGEQWRAVNYARTLIGRAGYYVRIAVSSGNANEVYISNSDFHESLDGGENFQSVPWGGDNHDIWVDPLNPDRIVVTDDGGINITTVHGRGFHRAQLPIGQMYHVAVDNQVPYYFYTNMQDDGNMRGPSTSSPGFGFGRGVERGWDHAMGGCESGFTIPDLTNTDIVWASCYGDEVTRWDAKNQEARSVSPWMHTLDSPPNELKYRCHWTPPLAIDPFDHNTVYYGCQVIFKTTNGGQSWTVISPDLSTNDPARNVPSGGLVGDNLGQFYGEVVFAIAPSSAQKGLIWAGTNDGQIWVTKDAGDHWTNTTKNIAGLPPLGTISSISPSTFDPGTAYVNVDLHLVDNRDPYIYKTTNFGETWTKISDGLPKHQLSYVRVVTEDPNKKGLLFAGTGNGIYYSPDDGGHWTALVADLPHVPVSWAVVQKQFHDLVISTYGRGIYILDDITPLEQMKPGESESAVQFFEPRPTYRLVRGGQAFVNYWLKAETKQPPKIEILDSDGKVIRELNGPGKEGINRANWDLRYESPRLVKLRTTPPENPHIWNEPRFRDTDSRPVTHWGIEEAQSGPIVAPGKYSVRLTINGKSFTHPLTILKDPRASGTDADIDASVKTLLSIRNDLSTTSDTVNQIEWLRKQVSVVRAMLKAENQKNDHGNPSEMQNTDAAANSDSNADKSAAPSGKKDAELEKALDAMDQKLQEVEHKFITPADMLSDDKYYSSAYKIYLNLIWLNGEVGSGAGDVAGGADFAPTDTDITILQMIEKDLAAAETDYHSVVENDLPAFNKTLAAHGMIAIAASAAPEPQEGGQ
jgi:photosystem II stability/assembly factor-like uncharacterized protein